MQRFYVTQVCLYFTVSHKTPMLSFSHNWQMWTNF